MRLWGMAAIMVACAFSYGARAADGDLDTSFGTNGVVIVSYGGDSTFNALGSFRWGMGAESYVAVGQKGAGADSDYLVWACDVNGTTQTSLVAEGGSLFDMAANGTVYDATNSSLEETANVAYALAAGWDWDKSAPKVLVAGATDDKFHLFTLEGYPFAPADSGELLDPGGAGSLRAVDYYDYVAAGRAGQDFNFVTYAMQTCAHNATYPIDIGTASVDEVSDLAWQDDGKYVLGGTSGGDFALARFAANATSIDATFGDSGVAVVDLGGADTANALAMQQLDGVNGTIVLGGTSDGDFALARFAPNGTLDDSFGTNGIVVMDLGAGDDEIFDVVVYPDNKIVAVGVSNDCVALVRLTVGGIPDPSFGTNGVVVTDLGVASRANAVAVLPDNSLLVAGQGDGNAIVLRYLALQAPTFTGLAASPNVGYEPLEHVRLEASVSTNGTTLSEFRWDPDGDGDVDAVTPSWQNWYDHTYHFYGEYDASCTAVDTELRSTSATTHVSVWPSDRAIIRSFSVTPGRGDAPLDVYMSVDATSTNSSAYYVFTPGDGGGPFATNNSWYNYTYTAPGLFAANCTVVGSSNATIVEHVRVWGNNPPVVNDFAADRLFGDAPLKVTFTVNATDEDADISTIEFDFHGDGSRTRSVNATLMNLYDTNGTDSSNGTTIIESAFTYFAEGTYTAKCSVVDNSGNIVAATSLDIDVNATKTDTSPVQSASVTTVNVNTNDSFPMGAGALLKNYAIAEGNFAPLRDVREFTASVVPANVPTTYRYTVAGLSGAVSGLRLYKLLDSGTNLPFAYAAAADPDTDGAWWITTSGGVYVDRDDRLSDAQEYYVNFVIRDNGPYDLDDAAGSIRDPQVLGSVGGGGGIGSGGGGGGCTVGGDGSASPGILLLILAGCLVIMYRRRRRGRASASSGNALPDESAAKE